MTSVWHALPADDDAPAIDWGTLIAIRAVVSRELEALRGRDEVGSSLEASVVLYADDGLAKVLGALGDELRFFLITSEASVLPAAEMASRLWVRTSASTHPKCQRCWHRREDVGQDDAHPALCGRCVSNLDGEGEQRAFV